uniref:RING-CH-type domain-containing protein n=1 Tax=Ditylenchus dipsaci TaxID=166011 RepID=A0A915E1P1_9BILA
MLVQRNAAFVHQECLEYWIKQSRHRKCDTCKSKYELECKGLKPMSDWKAPRPMSDNWEDLTDFYCAGLWAVLWMNVSFYLDQGGIASFNDTFAAGTPVSSSSPALGSLSLSTRYTIWMCLGKCIVNGRWKLSIEWKSCVRAVR